MMKVKMTKRENVLVPIVSVVLSTLIVVVVLFCVLRDKRGAVSLQDGGAVSLSQTQVAREDWDFLGISPMATSAWTIRATYTKEAVYPELDWGLSWASGDESSATGWGNGKDPSEYVKISPSSDTLTLTVSLLQPFGEQVLIEARNRMNPTIRATATADYAKRVTNAAFVFRDSYGHSLWLYSNKHTTYNVTLGHGNATDTMYLDVGSTIYYYSDVYTIDDTFEINYAFLSFGDAARLAKGYAQKQGVFNSTEEQAQFDKMEEFDSRYVYRTDAFSYDLAPDFMVEESLLAALGNPDRELFGFIGKYWETTGMSHGQTDRPLFEFSISGAGRYSSFRFDQSPSIWYSYMSFEYSKDVMSKFQ